MSQKVYFIKSQDKGKKAPDESTQPIDPPDLSAPKPKPSPINPTGRINKPVGSVRDRWIRVARAYLLGPLALAIWPGGRFRVAWAVLGAATIVAGIILVLGRSSINTSIQSTTSGVFYWIAAVAFTILAAATAWSRAVSQAGRDHPTLGSVSPRRLRHPATVGALGLIFPGLGLLLGGKARRAALVLWMAGPMVAALIVLFNWQLLWERSQWSVPAGSSGLVLESIFIAAAAVAAVTLLFWVAQALDGARRFCSTRASLVRADYIGLALLVAMVGFFATVRPATFASSLSVVSDGLQRDGFRLIPLGLYEAAARIDPASPVYLAKAAILNEELGMKESAGAKHRLMEQRLEQYTYLLRFSKHPDRLVLVFSELARRSPGEAPSNGGEEWARIRGLLRAQP